MKIALAQINPVIGDIPGNREKIISFVRSAKEKGSDIVVFPELAVTGYPPMDLLLSRKFVQDNIYSLEEIAKESSGIGIVCGFVDFDNDHPSTLYNAAAFMYEGKIVSRHHKTLLPTYDVFDEMRYFTPSVVQEPVRFKDKLLGITICEDVWNDVYMYDSSYNETGSLVIGRRYKADPVANLARSKIDILININASPYVKGKNEVKWGMISKIASGHSLPIVYVNQIGGNDSLIFDGNSFFINDKGKFTVFAKSFEEDIIIADDEGMTIIDPSENGMEDIRKALVLGIRDYFNKCGFKSAVVGLSGGIDSALTAALAVDALGRDKVTGITMPSVYSSKGSVSDSMKLARNLGIRFEEIGIKEIFGTYNAMLAGVFRGMPEDVAEENLQARIRGNILMAYSNKFGSLLLTTGNKSELAMGYCTLYGDMAGGLAVISDLPKTMVYELAGHINREREVIPADTMTKAPSAELRENQKDEDSLPPYEILDRILECYIELQLSAEEIIAQGYDERMVRDVLLTVNRNEYKRRQAAPGLKVTGKAFGIGRRLPMAQRFVP